MRRAFGFQSESVFLVKTIISDREFPFGAFYNNIAQSLKRRKAGRFEMRTVIVNMKDYIFSDAVSKALRSDPSCDFNVLRASSSSELLNCVAQSDPFAVLMEVNEMPPYTFDERLKTVDLIKGNCPKCKVVFVVDENSEKGVAANVREAKKAGIIDQFIYGSVSADYLIALTDTL